MFACLFTFSFYPLPMKRFPSFHLFRAIQNSNYDKNIQYECHNLNFNEPIIMNEAEKEIKPSDELHKMVETVKKEIKPNCEKAELVNLETEQEV